MKGKIALVAVFFFFTANFVFSQSTDFPEKGSGAEKLYLKGVRYFNKKDFTKAGIYFEKTVQSFPDYINPYLYLASIKFEMSDFASSESYYKKALLIDSTYNAEIYYSLAVVLEKQGKYEEALVNFDNYIRTPPKNPGMLRKAKSACEVIRTKIKLKKDPLVFEPVPLNTGINTSASEYFPVLTGDNKTLIFTRRINNQEDFFESEYLNGNWTNVKSLNDINSPGNEGANTITVDGKTMIFTLCDRKRTYGGCDLFMCQKLNGKWSDIRNLGPMVNSEYWDSHPSLSHDGKTLYFSSNRPGGHGGSDIWVSRFNIEDSWTKPECLDTNINSSADDFTPFIHADNQTLYFTSTGHPGLGSSDLFMSKKVNEKWTRAVNLGYPINTEDHEGGIFITLDGKTAYFCTDRFQKTDKNLDIYYFEVPENIKPEPVSFIKGVIFDSNTNEIIDAEIKVYDNNSSLLVNSFKTGKDSFLIALHAGVDYNLTVSKENYFFHSERFIFPENFSALMPCYVKIGLQKISSDTLNLKPIILNNIFFESGSSLLDTVKSGAELKNLLALLIENPDLNIRINGHTDNQGTMEFNMKLSESRAEAVYNFLLMKNISGKRIDYKGFGESKPVSSNDTEEGRKNNRRTEFEIIK